MRFIDSLKHFLYTSGVSTNTTNVITEDMNEKKNTRWDRIVNPKQMSFTLKNDMIRRGTANITRIHVVRSEDIYDDECPCVNTD